MVPLQEVPLQEIEAILQDGPRAQSLYILLAVQSKGFVVFFFFFSCPHTKKQFVKSLNDSVL